MKIIACIIPCLLILLVTYAFIKKINVYDAFVEGASNAVPLIVSIFPYLVAIFLLCDLFEISGLSTVIINFLSPLVSALGIPKELTKLMLLKPFSGSGSLVLLTD